MLPGGVTLGAGEADGGPGVGEAGQIFTGRRPADLQGAAAAGSARTNGETASSRATADAYEAFRVEFILTTLARDFDSGDRPGPGAGRVRAGQLGTDVALLQLDDLRLGSRAIDIQNRVLCSGRRVLGEVDLGVGDAHAGRGDSVRTGDRHRCGFGEANPGPSAGPESERSADPGASARRLCSSA